ncbi:uncharacterized protein LOC130806901 [Amaranthus tricolor]|uniref:uncharacterized protein LOC130806901 n=1 Tax=Amaranthus tricolor TaxID=29722 RepID=UPI00258A6E85|nr:uncharacterized protein LOC130806901 [Amaranthus tricolor]
MAPTKNLSTQQREHIMQKLLSALNKKGKPMLGTINALANEFQVCRKTITRLWNDVKKQMTNNTTVINLNSKRGGREAANKIKFDEEKFKVIKYELKGTQHSVAKLSFALSKCEYDEHNDAFKFKPYTNVVHIDEKHFYLTRETQSYYLAPGEVEPHRECQSKRYLAIYYTGASKKKLKEQEKGELETKPIQSITKEHIRAMLITNVLPTIRAKWPA